jgi:hypothetical protein
MRSMLTLHYESIVHCEFGSWKPVDTARELQLKGASQRGQEPLDTEAEEATTLEAVTRRQPVKITADLEVNWRMCELAIAL